MDDAEAKQVWEAVGRDHGTDVQRALRIGRDVHGYIHPRYQQIFSDMQLMTPYPVSRWTELGERVRAYGTELFERDYGEKT